MKWILYLLIPLLILSFSCEIHDASSFYIKNKLSYSISVETSGPAGNRNLNLSPGQEELFEMHFVVQPVGAFSRIHILSNEVTVYDLTNLDSMNSAFTNKDDSGKAWLLSVTPDLLSTRSSSVGGEGGGGGGF